MEKTTNQDNTQTDTKEPLSPKAGYNQHTTPTKTLFGYFSFDQVYAMSYQ